MALPREDLRVKLNPDDLARLKLVAEAEGMGLGEWAEKVITDVLRRRIHTATVLADAARRQGLSGKAIPDDN
jgi:hypothetical protein